MGSQGTWKQLEVGSSSVHFTPGGWFDVGHDVTQIYEDMGIIKTANIWIPKKIQSVDIMEGHKGFDDAAQWFPALNDLKKC